LRKHLSVSDYPDMKISVATTSRCILSCSLALGVACVGESENGDGSTAGDEDGGTETVGDGDGAGDEDAETETAGVGDGDGDACAADAVISGEGNQDAPELAWTPDGGLVMVGDIEGQFSIGGETFSSDNGDAFVFSLSHELNLEWTRTFGGDGSAIATDLDVAPDGAIVVVGNFEGTVDFGAGAVADGTIFVLELSPLGEVLRVRTFDLGPSFERPRVAWGPNGGMFLGATFRQPVDLDGILLEPEPGLGEGHFVAWFDPDGQVQWASRPSYQTMGLTRTPNGAIGADRYGTISAYSLQGEVMWTSLPLTGEVLDVDVGANGLVGVTTLWNTSSSVWLLEADGAVRWERNLKPDNSGLAAHALRFTPSGTIRVTGGFGGTLEIGDETLESAGSGDLFLIELDLDDTPLDARVLLGGSETEVGHSMAVHEDGTIALGVTFGSDLELPSGSHQPQMSDALVLTLCPE
jgi:WD40 repeat protein